MYKKRLFLLFAFLLLILASSCTITGNFIVDKDEYVEAAVYHEIEEKLETDQEVYVIVKLKEDTKKEKVLSRLNLEEKNKLGVLTEDPDLKLKHKYSTVNAFSGKLTKKGLKKLKNDPDVENIYIDKKFSIALDNSIPQIDADATWKLQINSTNITGLGETVCIVDTGVDYNHSDLGNGWGNKVIGGYRSLNNGADQQECSQNYSACFDDEGHGTHVAGIVSSNNSVYKGVAPDSKIVAVKVLDSSGSGWGSDIIAGIDWCVNNASRFNISVISISIGDKTAHNTYCNDDLIAPVINTAAGRNITVMVSAGNCEGVSCTAGISSPACVENATAVGAVNDADSIFYQRGALFQLLAPGVSIHSTQLNGGFTDKSGTSMAAPHASGAAVLLQQFNKLQNGNELTTSEIKEILNNTGILIDDSNSSGYNFSRIDVYAAVQSLILTSPNITSFHPNTTNITIAEPANQIFNITYEDADNDSISVEWYKEGINVSSKDNYTFIGDYSAAGSYNITVIINDSSLTDSQTWNLTVNNTYQLPQAVNLSLISTDSLNRTNGTLIGSWNYFDSNNGNQTDNQTRWYNNSIEVASLANLTSISSGNTSKDQTWIFSARVYDSNNWSSWVNSSSITIQNTPPEITPIDNISINASETVNITVNASDIDNDELTYSINNTNFNKTGNNFIWNTAINDSGIHTVNITVSE